MKIRYILVTLTIFFSFVLLLSGWVIAGELCVDDDNLTGTEDGTPQHPYNTIQEAVNAVTGSGEDKIYVATGDYGENITIENKKVDLFGGYPGGTTADYTGGTGGVFTGQNIGTYITHIQGTGTDAVVKLVDAGSATIDGFRITGGTGFADPWKSCGGGVYVSGGSPTISRNTIENNDVHHPESPDLTTFGGGIYSESSDIRIADNVIRNNAASGGGGVAVDGGTVVITGNTVQGNTADDFAHGGGLLIDSSDSSDACITHNRFVQNEVGRKINYGWGGGVAVVGGECAAALSYNTYTQNYAPTAGGGLFVDDGSRATLDHELIYNNESISNGGAGIYVDGAWDELGSAVSLSHCTIAYNVCTDCLFVGSGLSVEYYSTVTVKDSIFWGNGGDDFYVDDTSLLAVTHSLSEEAIQGHGNLNTDPLFSDKTTNDYHLKSTAGRWSPAAGGGTGGWVTDTTHSPAVDAGDPTSDYAKEPDPNGSRVNMGVYGNTAEASKSKTAGPVPNNGTMVTSDLWIRGVIDTVEKGKIEAVWQKGGEDTTSRGDRVIWGHFYASPSDVTWGSQNNPDLFVKIWFDVSGRVDVNYFHVSVPDIEVYSDYPYDGTADEHGTTTMSRRYIRQYHEGGQSYSDENYEDGNPPSGYSPAGNPSGYSTINDLRIGSIINTVEKGPIDAVWRLGGQDTTARGDQVVWGLFYASPSDVTWGSSNNPDLFVKIWFDVGGRVDVNFFHVSVPDIEVYSDLPSDGAYDHKGTTIMDNRYIRHEYWR